MKGEREVAGLRCGEVLERLPDYMEGTLGPTEADRLEAHLAGCDGCERFGGRYAATVHDLKAHLGDPEEVAPEVRRRLGARLDRDLDGEA